MRSVGNGGVERGQWRAAGRRGEGVHATNNVGIQCHPVWRKLIKSPALGINNEAMENYSNCATTNYYRYWKLIVKKRKKETRGINGKFYRKKEKKKIDQCSFLLKAHFRKMAKTKVMECTKRFLTFLQYKNEQDKMFRCQNTFHILHYSPCAEVPFSLLFSPSPFSLSLDLFPSHVFSLFHAFPLFLIFSPSLILSFSLSISVSLSSSHFLYLSLSLSFLFPFLLPLLSPVYSSIISRKQEKIYSYPWELSIRVDIFFGVSSVRCDISSLCWQSPSQTYAPGSAPCARPLCSHYWAGFYVSLRCYI